ncbi:hypothetical protein B9Z55_007546 [Caenorhabditis nigoni]|uniref:Uncharacterized protein n=1 Tax=Caenorhabditis nigoni TaxID=1611254 RepID=A0A2G5VA56_9PELO|nr:hypothetical protein B9Z55_007546 [Caenorhabditis nigoni]
MDIQLKRLHWDPPTTEKRVANIGRRKHVSLADFANFIIQDRPGLTSRFQGSGRLCQLLIIDMVCRIQEQRMQALTTKRAEFPLFYFLYSSHFVST